MVTNLDHSKTYRERSLKNFLHHRRLKRILALLSEVLSGKNNSDISYADVGCSNGYLTNLISGRFGFKKVTGYDFEPTFIDQASQLYGHIDFRVLDLTVENEVTIQYDLLTCFETLEHVGNLDIALSNLLRLVRPGTGVLVITVPVEIELWGILKYLAKIGFYRYSLSELKDATYTSYLWTLLSRQRISVYRYLEAKDWGTHFGFDYRDLEDIFRKLDIEYTAYTQFATRFFVIRGT